MTATTAPSGEATFRKVAAFIESFGIDPGDVKGFTVEPYKLRFSLIVRGQEAKMQDTGYVSEVVYEWTYPAILIPEEAAL